MGQQVNVIRPATGEVLTVTEEEAARLAPLGYQIEDAGAAQVRASDRAEEEYYTSTEQTLYTLGEGALSGLTLGGSDLLLNTEDSDLRAKHNPGTRIAGEIVGALAPALLTAGGSAATEGGTLAKLARFTPSGRLAEVAGSTTRAIGGLKGAVAGAALEGAVSGAGAEITRSELANDDLTVEGVLASATLGGAFGAGAGVLSHGLEAIGSRAQKTLDEADRLAEDLAKKASLTVEDARIKVRSEFLPDEEFGSLRNALTEYEQTAGKVVESAEQAVAEMDKAARKAARQADDALAKQFDEAFNKVGSPVVENAAKGPSVAENWMHLKSAGDQVFNSSPEAMGKAFAGNRSSIRNAYTKVTKAVEAGDEAAAREAMNEYREAVMRFQKKLGGAAEKIGVPEVHTPGVTREGFPEGVVELGSQGVVDPLPGVTAQNVNASVKAAREAVDLKQISKAVSLFPKTSEEFLKMSRGKAEQMFGALEKALATGGPELQQFKTALADQVSALVEKAGVAADGSPVDRLRSVYNAWRTDAVQKQIKALAREGSEARAALKKQGESSSPLGFLGRTLKQASSRQASTTARKLGAGAFLSSAAYQGAGFVVGSAVAGDPGTGLMGALAAAALGARARVMTHVRQAVAKWAPRAGRVVRATGARVEPLAYSATGIRDDESLKDRRELFKRRSNEMHELAAVGKDRAYGLASQFMAEGHADFAQALHQKMVAALDVALGKIPRDPGKTPWGFDSLWEPTPVQIETYSRVHRAVFNPLASLDAFSDGDVHPLEVEAVKTAYPGLYMQWKGAMLERLQEPGVMQKLSRQDLSELSIALDMDLTPTQRPEWIAAQQQMFAERAPQSNPNPSGPVGRPAGAGEQPTAAQTATNR